MDQQWMKYLLKKAQDVGPEEVPITGLLTLNNELFLESENTRQRQNDPMGHVEIDLIEKASKRLTSWRLENLCLYVLIEPCLLCTGAIFASRIPRVVFGVKNPKGGSLLYIQERRIELGLNHSVEIMHGFYEVEIQVLLQSFFQPKRL